MADPASIRGIAQPDGFGGVAAERPFAIDMLAGLDRGHHRPVMVRHFDADRDQVDIGMLRELFAIGEGQPSP